MHKAFRSRGTRKNSRSIAFYIPLLLLLTMSGPALALPGALDNSFSGNGIYHHLMGSGSNPLPATAASVAIQSDGMIVTAGQATSGTTERFALARYEVDGDLDPTFSGDGKAHTKFGSLSGATSVAIQLDQKIVAAGWKVSGNQTRFALARYKANGTRDLNFGINGRVITPIGPSSSGVTSVMIQGDQKIVAAGNARVGGTEGFAVARYLPNGDPDNSFDNDGHIRTPIGIYANATSAVINNGMIVVAGMTSTTQNNSRFALARYSGTNGALDPGFGNAGTVHFPFPGSPSNAGAQSVAIDANGMIVAAGFSGSGSNSRFALLRYDPLTGTLDSNFGNGGRVITNMGAYSVAYDVVIQTTGEIVAAGTALQGNQGTFAVARYDAITGGLDNNFDVDGKVKTLIGNSSHANSLAIQPSDDNIVVAGGASHANKFRFAIARYED